MTDVPEPAVCWRGWCQCSWLRWLLNERSKLKIICHSPCTLRAAFKQSVAWC